MKLQVEQRFAALAKVKIGSTAKQNPRPASQSMILKHVRSISYRSPMIFSYHETASRHHHTENVGLHPQTALLETTQMKKDRIIKCIF